MQNDELLRQAYLDAEKVRQFSEQYQSALRRETDWNGYRLNGYQPRQSDQGQS